MANRYKNQFSYGYGGDRIRVEGSFAFNAAVSPLAASFTTPGWSVARTAQGIFTITFDDFYVSLASIKVTLQLAALTARWAQVGAYTPASRTLVVTVHDATPTAQDVAAAANNALHFEALFRTASK